MLQMLKAFVELETSTDRTVKKKSTGVGVKKY